MTGQTEMERERDAEELERKKDSKKGRSSAQREGRKRSMNRTQNSGLGQTEPALSFSPEA